MDPKPIILTRHEVRRLLDRGEAELRRPIRSAAIALRVTYHVGDVLWVRESISTRRGDDGQGVRIRYPADAGQGRDRIRVIPIGEADWKFASEGYRTWPAKYCPRWASRLSVKVLSVRQESGGDRREVMLRVRVVSESEK